MTQQASKTVRANQAAAVRHPEHGGFVTPSPADSYPADDPLVRAYPWLFSSEDDRPEAEPALRESAPIERATRAPGERRPGRRPR
ncbi:hypothetical protein [Micromonospora aurantiaca (nom. illeg.)]|uniref:hypothetical protein n=1 Tax=Micromonospora aurantiaca (nom. illeg.) TaxID=47850 RepID=UPI003F49F5F9